MILNSVYAMFATFSFAIILNIRGEKLLFASFGGGLGWFFYLLCQHFSISKTLALFLSTILISIYSEAMARILKAPITNFIICAIIPLVPGNGMYYTMFETIQGNNSKALNIGIQTIISAGAIAVAIALVSSSTKLLISKKTSRKI